MGCCASDALLNMCLEHFLHDRFAPESDNGANVGNGIAWNMMQPIKNKNPSMSYGELLTLTNVVAIEEM